MPEFLSGDRRHIIMVSEGIASLTATTERHAGICAGAVG